jgi:hypothetical protein
MVHDHYLLLIDQLESGEHNQPLLVNLYQHLKKNLPSKEVLHRYHLYHDAGKFLCLAIDENGKRHFPDHAKWSADQFIRVFPEDGFTWQLIRHDMDFHTMRGDEIEQLWKNPLAPALYLTAWAEISANAEIFGGRESESYKIKRSRLLQHGKKFLNSKI